jgi:alanine racemase
VVAVRQLLPGETVSYGATARVQSPTTIATLAIGYADGVPRSLGNKGRVELLGRVVPIVGRVTMDMIMVHAGEDWGTRGKMGETATVFGGLVSLDEHAGLAGTTSYEILTSISPRVARRYRDAT